jgi:ABC-type lipoprotein export system ATPase subunit
MIKTENLKKVFRTEEVETHALANVSLEINEGEFVAIMGPSGCGKSTLLNILGLLDNLSEGKYFLNGIDVSKFTESERTKLRKGTIGFIFQSFNLIDELNVYENIELSKRDFAQQPKILPILQVLLKSRFGQHPQKRSLINHFHTQFFRFFQFCRTHIIAGKNIIGIF